MKSATTVLLAVRGYPENIILKPDGAPASGSARNVYSRARNAHSSLAHRASMAPCGENYPDCFFVVGSILLAHRASPRWDNGNSKLGKAFPLPRRGRFQVFANKASLHASKILAFCKEFGPEFSAYSVFLTNFRALSFLGAKLCRFRSGSRYVWAFTPVWGFSPLSARHLCRVYGRLQSFFMAIRIPLSGSFTSLLPPGTSHDVNQHFAIRGKVLEWQAGYGVVSFGTEDLPWVRQYIQNQRSHHATGKIVDRLERITEIETAIPGRNPVDGVDIVKPREEGCAGFGQPGMNAGPITG